MTEVKRAASGTVVRKLPAEESFVDNIAWLGSMAGMPLILDKIIAGSHPKDVKTQAIESKALISFAANTLAKLEDKHFCVKNFIRYTYSFWNQIKIADRNFFIKNASMIFTPQYADNAKVFQVIGTLKNRDGSYAVSDADMMPIFKRFQAMVRISIRYIHVQMKPVTLDSKGRFTYSRVYIPEGMEAGWLTDLNQLITDWELKTLTLTSL